MRADGLDFTDAVELRRLVGAREVSPVELVSRSLERAQATASTLNGFCHLMGDKALEQARAAERAVMAGDGLGPLHGLPLSIKDLIDVAGAPTRFGSMTTSREPAAQDAPSVARARSAGAIVIGKTTTSEFGCKPVGDSRLTGITRHPWDPARTPGGSSAGAAATVAAGITPFALGTDGGGSVRIPASLTGLVGIKAQFGRVPVWPVSATPTLAHVGPIARNVADAVLLLAAVAGPDDRDPFSTIGALPNLGAACAGSIEGMRIAWSPTLGYARPDAEVIRVTEAAARRFEQLGAIVEHVEAVFEIDPAPIWNAEFYAGVGTRLRAPLENHRDLLDPAVAAVLDRAVAQTMDAYYRTVFERYAVRERMRQFFEKFDLLLTPTLPVASLEAGRDRPAHLDDRSLVDWVFYTYPFNLTGQPALSLCAGLSDDRMPVGLQIVGGARGEADMIRAASAFERSMEQGYNLRRPAGAIMGDAR